MAHELGHQWFGDKVTCCSWSHVWLNEGTMTPAQQKVKEDELNTEQAALTSYQKEIEAFLNTKRQAMLTPIIDKLNKAVKEVGKENGYAYIFDQAVGNLLYAADSDDVTRLVEKN